MKSADRYRRRDRVAKEQGQAESEPREKKRMTPENYTLWLLGRREYARAEIEVKLRYRDVPDDEINELLDRMVELDLQSDERFVESQVRIHTQAGKGPGWIRARLQRLVPEALIAKYLPTDNEEWLQSARELVERRSQGYPLDMAQQRRMFSMLLRRGFSYDIARAALTAPER